MTPSPGDTVTLVMQDAVSEEPGKEVSTVNFQRVS
jgi:hypothetical protein